MGSTQSLEPTYIGAENHFKSFGDFVEWNRGQVGYAKGYELDADILKNGSKRYSADRCLLIPPALNRFIQGREKILDKELSRGLCLTRGKIWARLTMVDDLSGERVDLLSERFNVDDVESAKKAYQSALLKSVDIWIDRLAFSDRYCVDDRVIDYLLELSSKIKREGLTW